MKGSSGGRGAKGMDNGTLNVHTRQRVWTWRDVRPEAFVHASGLTSPRPVYLLISKNSSHIKSTNWQERISL